ncbi:MAG: hypothetical protein H0U73_10260 [Tatlockia sp.]|nr:hypothetical protein [Tatlockia sp.]
MMNFFRHLESYFASKFNITKDIFALFKLEAKLAAMNVPGLFLNISLLVVLLLTIWLTLMILLGDLIFILTKQPLIAIIGVLFIHLIPIVFVLRDLKLRLQQMSFARTRDCLGSTQEGNESEPTEERSIAVNHSTRSKDKN